MSYFEGRLLEVIYHTASIFSEETDWCRQVQVVSFIFHIIDEVCYRKTTKAFKLQLQSFSHNQKSFLHYLKAAVRRCSSKQVFSIISEILQERAVLVSLFNKVELKACSFIAKKLRHSCVPVTFAKFFRKPFFKKVFSDFLDVFQFSNELMKRN